MKIKKTMNQLIMCFGITCSTGLLGLFPLQASLSFQTIDMAAIGRGNASTVEIGSFTEEAFPFGDPVTLLGVPFILKDSPNQFWSAALADGGIDPYPATVTQHFPMAVSDIYGFYTLANLWWGTENLQTTKYIFSFSDKTTYEHTLTNGVDLRDFALSPDWSFTINGTTTQNIYADPNTGFHLDRQWIDLDAAGFGGKELIMFSVEDSGGSFSGFENPASRVFLAAATAQVGQAGQTFESVSAIPEPGSTLALAGLLGGGMFLRRRKGRVG